MNESEVKGKKKELGRRSHLRSNFGPPTKDILNNYMVVGWLIGV